MQNTFTLLGYNIQSEVCEEKIQILNNNNDNK